MERGKEAQGPSADVDNVYSWLAIGVALGSGVGLTVDAIPLGVGVGLALGALAGAVSRRRKRYAEREQD